MKQPAQSDLPFAVQLAQDPDAEAEKSPQALHQGDRCPQCKTGRLEYDGMLNLVCPACAYALSGCFT